MRFRGQCACKTRPARVACAAQHAQCRRSFRASQRCVGCATSAFDIAQFFARKRANVLQILFDFGGSAHAKLGWRVWFALRHMHCVGEALRRVSAAFGDDITRRRRSKLRNFSRENARTCCKFCSISAAVRMQNSAGACGVRSAARTVSTKLSGESALRLVTRFRDVGVRNRAIFREKTRDNASSN